MVAIGRTLPPDNSAVMMGWAALPTSAGRMIIAAGQTIGQNAVLALLPERDFAIAILANTSGGAQRLLLSIGAELLREGTGATIQMPKLEVGADLPKPPYDRFAGLYTNHTRASVVATASGLDITLTAKDLASERMQSQSLSLVPIDGDRFVAGPLDSPAAVFRFLFLDGGANASHFALGGALFARCDTAGRTNVSL
jgi:hypothetical protein